MSSYIKNIDRKYAALIKKEMKKKEKNSWRLIQIDEDTYAVLQPNSCKSDYIFEIKREFTIESKFKFYLECFGMNTTYIYEKDDELLTRAKRKFIGVLKYEENIYPRNVI